jgi:copper oxidase (laccase) domain-containing protein
MSRTPSYAEPLALPGGGRALFTGHAEGNLSTLVGPDAEHAQRAREVLCARWELRGLAYTRQVHGTTVLRHDSADSVIATEADGHATAQQGVGAMVLVADCLPVALGSEHAVAVVHAGWRGLAAGVIEAGVQALHGLDAEALAGSDIQRPGSNGEPTDRSEIAAIVGPGAGVCCYEVGEEVHAAFAGAHRRGRNIDLRAIAHDRLRAAGVAHIEDLAQCTICSGQLFSHRREGASAGRQAGVVWRASS